MGERTRPLHRMVHTQMDDVVNDDPRSFHTTGALDDDMPGGFGMEDLLSEYLPFWVEDSSSWINLTASLLMNRQPAPPRGTHSHPPRPRSLVRSVRNRCILINQLICCVYLQGSQASGGRGLSLTIAAGGGEPRTFRFGSTRERHEPPTMSEYVTFLLKAIPLINWVS